MDVNLSVREREVLSALYQHHQQQAELAERSGRHQQGSRRGLIDLERAALLGRLLATVSPPSDYEFGSYLTVSTKHLKADDAELLANHAGEPGSAVMVAATGYGWIVSLGCEEDEGDAEGALRDAGFSDGFVKLRRVLRGYRGGRYRRVEFDRDAPVQSDLQTYQWDRTVKQIPYERVVPTYAAKSA